MTEAYRPVIVLNSYAGTDKVWQTVAEWEVGKEWGKELGILLEIGISSSSYSKTEWRITAAGKTLVEAQAVQAATLFPFHTKSPEFEKGKKITVYARSTDGTSITAGGMIVAAEFNRF